MAYYEEGLYNVTILEHGLSESRHKKTPFVWLRCKIEGGEYERDVRLWITDRSVDMTVAKLRAIGWSGGSFGTLDPGGGSSLRNRQIQLRCQHEEYNGKPVERWDFPSSSQAAGTGPEAVEGLSTKLDALYGASLTNGNQISEAVPPVSSEDDWTRQVEDAEGDEIPF